MTCFRLVGIIDSLQYSSVPVMRSENGKSGFTDNSAGTCQNRLLSLGEVFGAPPSEGLPSGTPMAGGPAVIGGLASTRL